MPEVSTALDMTPGRFVLCVALGGDDRFAERLDAALQSHPRRFKIECNKIASEVFGPDSVRNSKKSEG